LLASCSAAGGLSTRRTPAFLSWRYGFEPLHYRAILARSRVDDGLIIFRVRRRGRATELVVCDVLVPAGDRHAAARLAGAALRETGADYALRIGGPAFESRFVRLPHQGPILTWREVGASQQPPLAEWVMTMGDVELF